MAIACRDYEDIASWSRRWIPYYRPASPEYPVKPAT